LLAVDLGFLRFVRYGLAGRHEARAGHRNWGRLRQAKSHRPINRGLESLRWQDQNA
jgi:hypothetical protein